MCTSVPFPPHGQDLSCTSLALQTACMFLAEASTLTSPAYPDYPRTVVPTARLLARGPWPPDGVRATWRDEPYAADPDKAAQADAAIAALARRGSPAHDGLAARLAGY